ncbi:MAG: carbamoyltransferase [Candidatus Magnetoovum sp. WYHC-5]|nr:carbamoyltransferase [Candidatus Magnetoovum sp. WYHC-5]
MKKEAILGISAYYHDSAAALICAGSIVAAAQEERFSRVKHDSSFPLNAARYVLEYGGVNSAELICVAFYDKPYLKFERLMETYHHFAPKGLNSFLQAMPVWIKEKIFMRKILKEELSKLGLNKDIQILFPEHHLSHAASAFYPSPFKDAAILTVDGVGEWATTTICHGKGKDIEILRELHFPHSLGLLYSAFTYYCGFKVNSGEYKLMGLAPYGDPLDEQTAKYTKKILTELIDLKEDGSMILNMEYFNYATGLTMCNDNKWLKLFGVPRRTPEGELSSPYLNMALAIQQITDEVVLRLGKTASTLTGSKYLTMAGGVALNCVSNGKLLREKVFEDIWIQPAAGDAGGALGAALAAWHIWKGKERNTNPQIDAMHGALLGPQYERADILRLAKKYNAPYDEYSDFNQLCSDVANLIASGKVIGWFQGKMEWGPRALGNRSIIGDARNMEMQKTMNLKIKYREGFRPFAPAVLYEDSTQYFDIEAPSPYMLIVCNIKKDKQKPLPKAYNKLPLMEKLYHVRSAIQAVTHVDYSARVQTVHKETNPQFWLLINTFKNKTGCPVVVNTSFNVRGEPIVCTPLDAYKCFMKTEMDYLVVENFIFNKSTQPPWYATHEKDYILD